jgi:uncharacterized membrane protein
MTNNSRKYGYWWALGLGCAIIMAFYGRFILNANEYLYSSGGDGLKNYYTFAWHVNYDSSYTHFGGMNQPFGEHVVFTDNQPLISNALRFINNNITYIGSGVIGINNLLLFIGLLVCIIYLYKLFFELTHNARVSIGGALVLGMLSPQIQRFNGHFALAYCFVIPVFIWWLYKFFNTPNWRTSRAMAITLLLLLFIHVYYLLIVGALVLSMWLIFIIRESPRINIFTAIPHIFIQIVLPFAAYFAWLTFTDTITDRPTKPYGIVEYAAYWEGLLLPLDFDYFEPLKNVFGVRKVSVETIAYAGFPSLVFIVWGVFKGIRNIFRRRVAKHPTYSRLDKPYNQRFMICLIWAVGIVFVYAAFVPFLFNVPAVSKYLGLLKQFRSLGRLLWIVYYGLTIFIVWYAYQKTKHKIKLNWVVWSILSVYALEGVLYNMQQTDVIDNPYKKVNWVSNSVNSNKYQAIIPLPYFHEGSENIGVSPSSSKIVEETLLLSMQTGIPTYGVKLSRTSLAQTLQQLEMGYEYTTIPTTLSKKTAKPYLLLHYIKDSTSLPELKGMRPIAATDSFKLYRFSPKLLEVLLIKRATHIERKAAIQSNSLYFFDNYDSLDADEVFAGQGALQKRGNETVTLVDTACNFCSDSLSVSFWLYANMEGLPEFKLLVNNKKGVKRIHIPNHIKSFNKNWMLVEYTFKPSTKNVKVQLIKENRDPNQTIYLDNLLIRSARYDVLQVMPNFVARNNRVLFQNTP